MVSLGKSDSLLADVVDVAVGANPSVSEDPGGTETSRVHAEEGKGALKEHSSPFIVFLSETSLHVCCLSNLSISKTKVDYVFHGWHIVLDSVDGEDEIRLGLLSRAWDGVKLVEEVVLGSGLLDNGANNGGRCSDP